MKPYTKRLLRGLTLVLALVLTLGTVAAPRADAALIINSLWHDNVLKVDPLSTICPRKEFIASVTFLDSTVCAPKVVYHLGDGGTDRVLGWAEWDNYGMGHIYIAADFGINGEKACANLFKDCDSLTEINFNGAFHTDFATSMQNMFYSCANLKELDLSTINTANVTNMSYMFSICSRLEELDLTSFDTAKVTTMASMFSGCSELEKVDTSSFDTSRVTDMSNMFRWCDSLRTLYLSGWDFSNVRSYTGFMNEGVTINGRPWKSLFD